MSEATPPKTILVVEDSDLSRAVITRQLEKHGFRVLTAADGAEGAVVALRELPDVVVTDIEMPVMNGYQLARLLKSDPSAEHMALLILTSHGEASSRFWGLETGADAFLVKDHLDDELVPAVQALLENSPAPARGTQEEAPQTPLDVLARVTRHLDARLLDAVLVNRIFENGMQAETLADASAAILDAVSQIVDAWILGLAVGETESTTVYLRLAEETSRGAAEESARRLESELDAASGSERRLSIEGGSADGRAVDPASLFLLPLPMRSARAVLAVAPREGGYADSREQQLLERIRQQLSLVIDNARLAERLRELSMRDDLTRLLNRRTIRQRLREELQRAQRYGHPLSIAICDLDHFKRVNDTFGHQAGDRVLIAIVDVLEEHARTPDVAGRYGGEEFLIVLPETDIQDAAHAAQRLRRTIESSRTVLPDGQILPATASLGVAALSEIRSRDAGALDELLALADQRLYAAKAAGRNKVIP